MSEFKPEPTMSDIMAEIENLKSLVRLNNEMTGQINSDIGSVRAAVDEVKPLVAQVGEEVKSRGIAGILPMVLGAMRSK